MTLNNHIYHRAIRSFVIREGRMTPGQQKALDELWPDLGINNVDALNTLVSEQTPNSLDIGFGNGESLIHAAQTEPDRLHIGIEVHRPGIGNLLLKAQDKALTNIRVICHDAAEVIEGINDLSLDRVLIFFPDPWPKKRHHKRRLIQTDFINRLYPKIKQQGTVHIATDWQPYAEHIIDVMNQFDIQHTPLTSKPFMNIATDHNTPLQNTIPCQYPFVSRPDYRPVTKYERRGTRLGHDVFDLIYRKA